MNLFTVLPVTTKDSSLPQLNPADVRLFGDAEYGASGHWLLGGGASSLTGITASKSLLSEGDVSPVWSGDYVTLNGYQAGLTSPSLDSEDGLDSFCLVFKTQGSVNSDVVLGNASTTSGDGGFFVATNASGELYITARGTFDNRVIATGILPNSWYFISISRNFSGDSKELNYFVGGISTGQTLGTGVYIPNADNMAVGNINFNNASRPMDYAEFITYSRVISTEEMNSIYERSKVRMSDKGISIV